MTLIGYNFTFICFFFKIHSYENMLQSESLIFQTRTQFQGGLLNLESLQ